MFFLTPACVQRAQDPRPTVTARAEDGQYARHVDVRIPVRLFTPKDRLIVVVSRDVTTVRPPYLSV